ncbi:hypothetical protein ACHAXR_006405 [Thalassiosira sp. AJA248-18]
MMKIFCACAAAVLVGGRGGESFNFNSMRVDVSSSIGNNHAAPTFIHSPCLNSRPCTGLHMNQSCHNEPKEGDNNEIVDTSRRAAFRQCSSIFAAAAFATTWNRQEAQAASFSDSLDERAYYESTPPVQSSSAVSPPQFLDETVITPPQVVLEAPSPPAPDSSASAATTMASTDSPPPPSAASQVTLENDQVVTIPMMEQVSVSNPSSSPAAKKSQAIDTHTSDYGDVMHPQPTENTKVSVTGTAELGLAGIALGATYFALFGKPTPSFDELTAVAKVVMITPDPYGTTTGRRYYNGVDVTINDPVPASDVREYCEAGKVNNDCTETITGFLGEIGNGVAAGESPSVEQQETANAVLSYLDSMTHSSPLMTSGDDAAASKRAMAFSSYLNILSSGEIDAPKSPQSVANYLDSLNAIENRVNALESSVNQMPDKISGRMQEWQMRQDERLANEFLKIESYLVNKNDGEMSSSSSSSPPVNGAPPVNGEGHQDQVRGLKTVFYNDLQEQQGPPRV